MRRVPVSAVRVVAVAPEMRSMEASAGVAHQGTVVPLAMLWELVRTALPMRRLLMSG